MSDTIRVRLVIETGYPGCSHESEAVFLRQEWDNWTEEERENACGVDIQDLINNYIEGWWEVVADE